MLKVFKIIFCLALVWSFNNSAQAQSTEPQDSTHYIQFSGFVLDGDSLIPIPYTMVYNTTRKGGRLSDIHGYFSVVAAPGDVVRFSNVTYKDSYYTIPDTITGDRYTMYYMMEMDTFMLNPVYIYPWPSQEEFADAFVNFDVPDDDLERARKNLEREEMRQRVLGTPGDGSINFKWNMQQHQEKLYYSGQAPPIQLLNPIAWSKFIKAWKNGDFKRQDKQ